MASLPILHSNNQELTMVQTKWAAQINPVLSNPLSTGYILKNIALASGVNTINHLQEHVLNGWIVVGMHGAFAQIYDSPSPMPKLTLILNSSAATTIDLVVF